MTGSRTITFAVNCGKVHSMRSTNLILRTFVQTHKVCCGRGIHTQSLTSNIEYITSEEVQVKADPNTMKLGKVTDKPICIMLNWLMQPRKLKLKYAGIYLDEGFDVVSVNIRPMQLMWPKKGAQLIGRDILKLMSANNFNYMVHGYSVGGYVWSEALVAATKDLDKYQPVLDRVSAQVWDCVADVTAVTSGVPLAMFPERPLLQKTVKALLELYLLAFWSVATKHYKLASETYYSTPCRAPCLFLVSSQDTVGTETNIRNACQQWRDMGIRCTLKVWERAVHCRLYITHREEYLRLLRTHIRENFPQLFSTECEAPYKETRQKMRAV